MAIKRMKWDGGRKSLEGARAGRGGRLWRARWYLIAVAGLMAASLASFSPSCGATPTIYQPTVPDAVAPGGGAFTLVVNGNQFTTGSTIEWNGVKLQPVPSFTATSTQLQGTVPASLIATPGTAAITVFSGEGGGSSNVIYFPVWRPSTTATFVTATGSPIAVGVKPAAVLAVDLNGDNIPDLAVANSAAGTVTILLGNGDGTFTPAAGSPIAVGTGADALAVGDFNVDGIPDLAVANGTAGTVTVLLGLGNATYKPTTSSPITVGTGPDALAVADFNGDGDPDLAVANAGSNNVLVLKGDGTGNFSAFAAASPVGTSPTAMALGDFNKDDAMDLVVANAGSANVSVLLGNGDGTFQAATNTAVGTAPSALAVADLTGDGNLDVAVANSGSDDVTILTGNGTGALAAAGAPISVGSAPSGLAIADFNADNQLDLAVTNSGDSTVTVLLGSGGGHFAATPVNPPTGIGPSSLAVADFNGDGRLDIATVNNTDNTASVLLQPVGVTLSTSSLTYVEQGLRSTSAAQTVTITNNTSAPLTLATIAATGGGATDFAAPASGSSCSTTTPVPPGGGSCTLNVTFTPLTVGPITATLSITTNSTVAPTLSVDLSGTGFNGGEVALAPSNLTYPLQRVNTTSNPQVITLSNVGAFPVNISAISTSLSQFVIVPPTATGVTPCQSLVGSSLALGAQCVIPITFAPTAAGTLVGDLNITDDAALSPQSVVLTGTGTNVDISPAGLTFPAAPIGTASGAESVTLKNVGNVPLTLKNIAASGPFAIASGTTCSVSAPLAGGATCTVSVTFTPTSTGSLTGALSLTDSDPSSPQEVPLTGVGQDFSLATFNTSQTIIAGGTTSYLLSVSPQFGFTGSVSLTCSGAPMNSTCAVSPSSVALTGSGDASPSVQVTTSQLSGAGPRPMPPFGGGWPLIFWIGGFGLAGLFTLKRLHVAVGWRTPVSRWVRLAPLAGMLLVLAMGASCGGGAIPNSTAPANYGTPPGTYILTVTATGANLTHSAKVTLVVTQ